MKRGRNTEWQSVLSKETLLSIVLNLFKRAHFGLDSVDEFLPVFSETDVSDLKFHRRFLLPDFVHIWLHIESLLQIEECFESLLIAR